MRQKNVTYSATGIRAIMVLAVPAMAATLADPLLSITDTALVARLGTAPLASLQLCTDILSIMVWLFNFLSYGVTAQLALLISQKRHGESQQLVARSLQLAAAIGLGLSLILLIGGPWLLKVTGAQADVLQMGRNYLLLRAPGMLAAMINLSAIGILRGMRDTKSTLWITLFANLINLFLDLLLIFGFWKIPAFGMAGAAVASLIAQYSAMIVYLRLLASRQILPDLKTLIRPALNGMSALIRVSGDLFLRTAFLLFAFMTATVTATRLGTPELASHGIAMKMWMLVVFLIEGYEIAGQAMTGNLLGNSQIQEAKELGWRLLKLGLATGCAFALLFFLFQQPLTLFFDPEIRVKELLSTIFPLIIILQPLNGMAFVLDGLLIGAGDTAYLRRAMLLSGPPIMLFTAWLALNGHGGLKTVWLGLAGMMSLRFITNGWRFLSGGWTKVLLEPKL